MAGVTVGVNGRAQQAAPLRGKGNSEHPKPGGAGGEPPPLQRQEPRDSIGPNLGLFFIWRGWQRLRLGLLPLLGGRRKRSGWRLLLLPFGSSRVWRTSVLDPG